MPSRFRAEIFDLRSTPPVELHDLECLVRLNLLGMVGSSLLRQLLEHHELRRIPCLTRRDLERISGIGPITAEAIAATTRLPLTSVEHALDALCDKGLALAGVGGGFSRPADGATMAAHGRPPE